MVIQCTKFRFNTKNLKTMSQVIHTSYNYYYLARNVEHLGTIKIKRFNHKHIALNLIELCNYRSMVMKDYEEYVTKYFTDLCWTLNSCLVMNKGNPDECTIIKNRSHKFTKK